MKRERRNKICNSIKSTCTHTYYNAMINVIHRKRDCALHLENVRGLTLHPSFRNICVSSRNASLITSQEATFCRFLSSWRGEIQTNNITFNFVQIKVAVFRWDFSGFRERGRETERKRERGCYTRTYTCHVLFII